MAYSRRRPDDISYNPDNWVIIKIKGDDPHYRVLAGWIGDHLVGHGRYLEYKQDSWRLNSGIIRSDQDDHHYYFYGKSGSRYRCGKFDYTLKMNNIHIWEQMQKHHGDKVTIMPEDTDWINLDWIIG